MPSSKGHLTRRFAIGLTIGAALQLGVTSLASAADFQIFAKWRHCEKQAAGLSYRTTFIDPARHHGRGRYMIKSQIRWDKYASGEWRNSDANTIQTPWTQINNRSYDFSQFHGDRTVWGNLFAARWRAHVIVKLIKNRPGPRDKRVETVDRYFEKPMFDERGSCYGVG